LRKKKEKRIFAPVADEAAAHMGFAGNRRLFSLVTQA